jgi:dynein heavy chain
MFFDAVYQQLHVVIAASPSDSLKNLLLENPQIVTSCTIDFMNRWPDEALYEVAEINMSDDIFHKDQKFKLSRVASLFHRAVESVIEGHKLSILLSPRRYLELISLFSFKYQVRSEESTYIIGKLKKCIDKYS